MNFAGTLVPMLLDIGYFLKIWMPSYINFFGFLTNWVCIPTLDEYFVLSYTDNDKMNTMEYF